MIPEFNTCRACDGIFDVLKEPLCTNCATTIISERDELETENAALRLALKWAEGDKPRDLEINKNLPIEEQLRVWRLYLQEFLVAEQNNGARNSTRLVLQYNPEEKVAALRARVGRLEALAKEVEYYLEHEGASEDLYLAWKALEAEGAGEGGEK